MTRLPHNTALIIVDMQQGLDDPYWGPRNNPEAEANAGRLLDHWRAAGRPLFHIHHRSVRPHSPLYPGKPGVTVKPEAAPRAGEPVMMKTVNSAFIGTELEQRLHDAGIQDVVIVGLTTNHCVDTSTRMASNLGFRTILVSDATAANDREGPDGTIWPAQTVHDVSLANLHDEFATILTTSEVIARAT